MKDINPMDNNQLKLSIDDKQLSSIRESLKRIDPNQQDSVARKMMTKVGAIMERGLKDNLGGKILKRRTGRLASSIGFKVSNKQGNWVAEIGSGARTGKRVSYANILETGGTIRPKKTRYLAIPLKAALTRAGAPRKSSPRDWAKTFIKKSNAGNLIIFQSQSNGKILPLYVLKKSVRINAKRYMEISLRETSEKILSIMNKEISEALG